jgi:hypothetical protein
MSHRTPSLFTAAAVVTALAVVGVTLPAATASAAPSAPMQVVPQRTLPVPTDPTTGVTPDTEAVDLTVVLRPTDQAALRALPTTTSGATGDERAAAVAEVAPESDDRAVVHAALTAAGFAVTDVDTWQVEARGTAAQAEAVFGVELLGTGDGMHPAADPVLSGVLGGAVTSVLGLDTRPVVSHAAVPGGYAPADLASAYASSTASSAGAGATIATVQFSGWDRNDLAAYAAAVGRPVPALDQIAVDGADVHRGDGYGGETEVALDQEALLAVAPSARHRVYIAPNSFQGMYHAYSELADDVRSAGITAVSISWGGCESLLSDGARMALDDALDRVVAAGATVFAASGDSGATCQTGPSTSIRDVSYPASSPAVVGVGGTALLGSRARWSETGWSNEYGAGGGGTSGAYAKPSWQIGAGVTGTKRLVPDVAAVADPTTGPGIWLGASHGFVYGGGTSLASPVVAGQFAAALSARGCAAGVGDVHGVLYANPGAFRDVTTGSNGTWNAAAGYDRATGLGTPQWSRLGALLPVASSCPLPTGAAAARASATSVTSSAATVPAGTSIHSPNGQYWLDLQQDGNLVEWGNGRALWSTKTSGAGNTMALGTNGVLAVKSASGAVLWSSKTATSSGSAKLTVTDMGDVRVTAGGGRVLWRNKAPGADRLVPGASLVQGQSLWDTAGKRRLVIRADGQMRVMIGSRTAKRVNSGGGGSSLQMAPNGDVVLWDRFGKRAWSTGTSRAGGAKVTLRMQTDGNLVLRKGTSVLWKSGTKG